MPIHQRAIVVAGLVALAASCQSFNRNFSSSAEADLGYFADSTLALLAELEPVMSRQDAIYVRDFIRAEDPEETALRESLGRGFDVVRAIAVYSTELVTIVESNDDPAEQVEAYMGYMRPLAQRICEACDLEDGWFDERLDEAAEATTLLEAIRISQPILSVSIREALSLADRAEEQLRALAGKLEDLIDAEFADVIRYNNELEIERAAVLRSFECVYHARRGDLARFDELRELGTVHAPELIPEGAPTPAELMAISDHLLDRLDDLARIRKAIDTDWQEFRAAHLEVDTLEDEADTSINRYRVLLILWMRAHQKMASGTVHPAAWFDLSETPAMLFRLGTRAL